MSLPSQQPAEVYSAWLEQVVADLEGAALERVLRAARQLKQAHEASDDEPLLLATRAVGDSLDAMDLGLLGKPGWLSRVTGRASVAVREFTAQYDQVLTCTAQLAAAAAASDRRDAACTAGAARPQLELEMESRAWRETLMRAGQRMDALSQLVARAEPSEQAERNAGQLPARLKHLEPIAQAARQVLELRLEAAAARELLGELLQGEWGRSLATWKEKFKAVVDALERLGPQGAPAGDVLRTHKELRRLAHRVYASCSHLLQQQEMAMQGLAALCGEDR